MKHLRWVHIKYLIDFAVLFFLYAFVFFKKWKSRGRDILIVNTLMYIYLSFVLFFTDHSIYSVYSESSLYAYELDTICRYFNGQRRFYKTDSIKYHDDHTIWFLITIDR